ncbi:hypothetical protein EWE75_24540 [Sphingomonas populi]|uniref:Uncharacterized protein n=1 Tax=Sphingomonas populi TaxID=2484750 RepID=A0A4Q6XFP9_9SPHN|nr:hypothetical protein EWE75_24540 [Sphingomonas populi]
MIPARSLAHHASCTQPFWLPSGRQSTHPAAQFLRATSYKWVKSAEEILASVKRLCQKTMNRTSDSGD